MADMPSVPTTSSELNPLETLRKVLKDSFGLADDVLDKVVALGVNNLGDLTLIQENDLTTVGIPLITARKIVRQYAPAPVSAVPPVGAPAEVGEKPTTAEVNNFATSMGIDSNFLNMLMLGNFASGAGMGEFDLSSMLPVAQVVAGYNPKIRNIPYMIMGQLQAALGGLPIIVINSNGSVNPELTQKYVLSLQEGFDPAEDDIYYDDAGLPYQVIKVGVDMQSIYDADPLDSTRALQENGIGTGRVQWKNVALEIRQAIWEAVNKTRELTPTDESKLQWLRTNIKPGITLLALRGEFPKAITQYYEDYRTGSLPTLRVQLTHTRARRPSIMPNRRSGTPRRDLPGRDDAGFRRDDDR